MGHPAAESARWGTVWTQHYSRRMHSLLAVVWHQWIAVALVVPSLLLIPALVIMYVKKVVVPRYPKQ